MRVCASVRVREREWVRVRRPPTRANSLISVMLKLLIR
jgi:hypothetical protein